MRDEDQAKVKVIRNVMRAAAGAGYFSVSELAAAADISRPTLIRRLSGVTSFRVTELFQIGQACRVRASDLLPSDD